MSKYIGIIIFCSAVSAYGAYYSYNISQASRIRNEILSLIRHTECGIRYGNAPLQVIFQSFSSPVLEKYRFLELLNKNSFLLEDVHKSLYLLTEDERNSIYEMLCNIGKSHYAEKELSTLSSYFEFFSQRFEKSQKDDCIRAPLYKKLGLIAALISAIILI